MRAFIRIFAFAACGALIPGALALAPRPGEPVVIVADPFGGKAAIGILAEADGNLLASTAFDSIAVGQSTSIDFVTRLRRAGAWLVLNGKGAGGCWAVRTGA